MFFDGRFGRMWRSVACRTTLALGLVMALGSSALAQVGADFNGDGYGDLAIGVPYDDEAGASDAGVVNVLYGSPSGLQATGVGGPNDQLWQQGSAGVGSSPEPEDHFGEALAAGDFNDDGFDDLVIGVPHEDVGSITDAGAVHVLYGSAGGLQATGAGGPVAQLWDQDSTDVLGTADAYDHFGWALAAGDFNHDGFDDLVVGVPFEHIVSTGNGWVNVLYGSAAGLQATGVGGPNDQYWRQGLAGVQGTPEEYDYFGWALAAGDFNDDGFDDLSIGVNSDSPLVPDQGAVNVLYGSAGGLQATGVGAPNDQYWYQGYPGLKDQAESGDYFGTALTAGDFNGDGEDDLAIGAPSEGIGNIDSAGAVSVLYGSTAGLQVGGGLGFDDQFWHQDVTGVQDPAEAIDAFGDALASGDFNNDGYDDLAVGAPHEFVGSIAFAGAVNVLYGAPTGLHANGVGGSDDQFWYQGVNGVDAIADDLDLFGRTLAAADFNNDGRQDLAIGVPQEDEAGAYDVGAVNVLYGSAAGLQANGVGGPNDQYWHQGSTGVNGTPASEDGFGWALH